jgi:hypothetical protein
MLTRHANVFNTWSMLHDSIYWTFRAVTTVHKNWISSVNVFFHGKIQDFPACPVLTEITKLPS